MTDKLKQIAKEEIAKLPKEIQEAINSLPWGSITEEIGRKYLLSDTEINDFQTETLLVLVGLEAGDDYARNVENNVGVSKVEAEKMTEEVEQKIFGPIYDLLAKNVKGNLAGSRPPLEQNVNFILSGGNYLAFLEKKEEERAKVNPVGSSSTNDMKDKLIN